MADPYRVGNAAFIEFPTKSPSNEENPPSNASPASQKLTRNKASMKFMVVLLVFIIILCLLIFLTERNPAFSLNNAAIDSFSVSDNAVISMTMHVTISSREPLFMSVTYNGLKVSVRYRGTPITRPTPLPMTGPGSTSVVLNSMDVLMEPALAVVLEYELNTDNGAEMVISVEGRIRKKMLVWWPMKDDLTVNCVELFRLNGSSSTATRERECHVV
ncbi:hypothetical protein Dimus_032261 [Dionaea muscipula]